MTVSLESFIHPSIQSVNEYLFIECHWGSGTVQDLRTWTMQAKREFKS